MLKLDNIENNKIMQPRLVLTEGRDAQLFLINLVKKRLDLNYQIIDFGGNADLTKKLQLLSKQDDFEIVSSILICRDAEQDANAAADSIKTSLTVAGYVVPESAYEFVGGPLKVAYALFPGIDDNHALRDGTLEDLLFESLQKDNSDLLCVEQYLNCVELKSKHQLIHRHKSQLHSYLSPSS